MIINIENEIDATFSLLIFIIVYLMKNYGELIGIIVPSLMHQLSYKQPVKFKDRNMRDKCFHLNNQFLMLIFKFYSLCLFNEFLKKKFIIYIHQCIQTQVFFLASFEKKKMNLTCLKIKERNSDWNFVKKENERKRENSLQALEIRCYVVFPTCF